MSNLNPGGSPNRGQRIYGAANIERHLKRHKPDHAKDAVTSIADKPHAHGRQAARLARQAARQAAKRKGS
jgi:hypothetical protein